MSNNSVVLASGGMDSFLAWFLFAREAQNVFVNIAHKYSQREIKALTALHAVMPEYQWVHRTAAQVGSLELPCGIIPHRNAHLILAAAELGTDIILGVVADEINSDKSIEFFDAMARVLTISYAPQYWNGGLGKTYTVRSPMREMTKSEAVSRYLQVGGPVNALLSTVSCYAGTEGHCGACPSCFKRWIALLNNGLPTLFDSDPYVWGLATGTVVKAFNGTYAEKRASEIASALKRVGRPTPKEFVDVSNHT